MSTAAPAAAYHRDLTIDEYHSDCPNSFSHSEVDMFISNPADFQEIYLTGEQARPYGKQFDVGHVAHELILGDDYEFTFETIHEGTTAAWVKWEAPNRDPDFEDGAAAYWYIERDDKDIRSVGPAVVRYSDHWGKVGPSVWDVIQPGAEWWKERGPLVGMCRLDNFMPRDVPNFEPIPSTALSSVGHKRGDAWKQFAELHHGKLMLTPYAGMNGMEGYACIPRMRRSVRRHSGAGMPFDQNAVQVAAKELIWADKGYSEYSIYREDPETGLLLRCRADRLVWPIPGPIWGADLKTAESANRAKWARSATTYGYHRQAAWYEDLIRAMFDVPDHFAVPFVFVVVEKSKSCRCECFQLEPELVEIGRTENRTALRALAKAMEKNVWLPRTNGTIGTIHTPFGMMREKHEHGTG